MLIDKYAGFHASSDGYELDINASVIEPRKRISFVTRAQVNVGEILLLVFSTDEPVVESGFEIRALGHTFRVLTATLHLAEPDSTPTLATHWDCSVEEAQ